MAETSVRLARTDRIASGDAATVAPPAADAAAAAAAPHTIARRSSGAPSEPGSGGHASCLAPGR